MKHISCKIGAAPPPRRPLPLRDQHAQPFASPPPGYLFFRASRLASSHEARPEGDFWRNLWKKFQNWTLRIGGLHKPGLTLRIGRLRRPDLGRTAPPGGCSHSATSMRSWSVSPFTNLLLGWGLRVQGHPYIVRGCEASERYRANMAHVRQSRSDSGLVLHVPYSGLGSQVKVLKTLKFSP